MTKRATQTDTEREGMRTTTKLLLLSLLNIAVMATLAVQKFDDSAIDKLVHALRGNLLTDSSAFMQEAWRVAHAGLPIYPTVFFGEHLKFQYPTSSLLLGYIAVVAGISMFTLIKWMVLASWALTLIFAAEIFLRLLPVNRSERWPVRLLIISLGVFFYPLILGARFGQIQTVLTFLFTLAVWLWMQERKVAAGICLALACAVKPPLGLFLVWGALRREWRFFWAFVATVTVVQSAAIAIFGWSNEVGYLAALSYMGHRGECIGENQSVNGWLQRLLRNGEGQRHHVPPIQPGGICRDGCVVALLCGRGACRTGVAQVERPGWRLRAVRAAFDHRFADSLDASLRRFLRRMRLLSST